MKTIITFIITLTITACSSNEYDDPAVSFCRAVDTLRQKNGFTPLNIDNCVKNRRKKMNMGPGRSYTAEEMKYLAQCINENRRKVVTEKTVSRITHACCALGRMEMDYDVFGCYESLVHPNGTFYTKSR